MVMLWVQEKDWGMISQMDTVWGILNFRSLRSDQLQKFGKRA